MGKLHTLPVQQANGGQQQRRQRRKFSVFCCSRLKKELTFKCFAILLLTVSLFLSTIFSLLPRHHPYGFDAKSSVKHLATVQAFFKLEVPVSVVVPYIELLEYEINEEIGVPYSKVAVLSVHEYGSSSNYSGVVFGSLPDPPDVPISPVPLSLLKSSFIDLFTLKSKLTFRSSVFGQPSDFEILKFPGGITIIPAQSATVWQIQHTLFNFTLHNSVYEIIDNFAELQKQLKIGLNLKSSENVYIQVSNEEGSTVDHLVTVQASIMSDLGTLHPERLKQLAETLTQYPPKNLGLSYIVFGKVKEISLSSYLKDSLQVTSPTPSPAPSPDVNEYAKPPATPVPSPSPSNSPHSQAPSPIGWSPTSSSLAPASNVFPPVPCSFERSCTPRSAPAAAATAPSPVGYTPFSPSTNPPGAQLHPSTSPLPPVIHGSSPSQNAPSPSALSSSTLAASPHNWEIWVSGFLICLLLY